MVLIYITGGTLETTKTDIPVRPKPIRRNPEMSKGHPKMTRGHRKMALGHPKIIFRRPEMGPSHRKIDQGLPKMVNGRPNMINRWTKWQIGARRVNSHKTPLIITGHGYGEPAVPTGRARYDTQARLARIKGRKKSMASNSAPPTSCMPFAWLKPVPNCKSRGTPQVLTT